MWWYLWICDRGQPLLFKLCDGVAVVSKVKLGPHQYEGDALAVVADLGVPLGPNVLEGSGVHQGKTYQEDVLENRVICYPPELAQ